MNDLIETNYDSAKINKKQVAGADLLFNKHKISNEIASLSSMSSISSQSSLKSEPREKINVIKKNNINMKKYESDNNDDTDDTEEDDDEIIKQKIKKNKKQQQKKVVQKDEDSDEDDEEDDDDDKEEDDDDNEDNDDDDDEDVQSNASDNENKGVKKFKNELTEKREILYQLNRLQAKGYDIPSSFTMQSDLHEMKQEYEKIVRDKDVDGSIRFQRKMLMAFVTGTEYLNNRYDPFSIKLEGWSEQIHENIIDYDDIFEELHEKYKAKGKKMAPELRLFISLTGSAFMFHLTSRMFKESSIPGVEEVFKANPELMKQFQNAAAKQFVYKNTGLQEPQKNIGGNVKSNNSGGMGGAGGLFGMIGNLFGGLTNTSFPQPQLSQQQSYQQQPQISQQQQQSYQQQQRYNNINNKPDKSFNDINNIINNVHSKISPHLDEDNKIETLSISDEEITSIIEDATDVRILKSSVRGRKSNKDRTLNI
jgi:hypothetical protein